MTESLLNARKKLASVLEIYTPFGAARENAVIAMTAAVVEFEEAVREDERAKGADSLARAQVETNDALARAYRAESAAARPAPVEPSAAQAKPEAVIGEIQATVGVKSVELVTPEGQRFDLGEGAPESLSVPEDQDRVAAQQDAAPEVPGVNAPAARSGRKRGG